MRVHHGILLSIMAFVATEARAQCTADAGPNVTICSNESATLGGSPSASGGQGPYTYTWTPGTGLNDPNVPAPVTTVNGTTTYTLTIEDSNGCTDTDQVTVTVQPAPNLALNAAAPVLTTTFNGLTTYFVCGVANFTFNFADASSAAPGSTFSVDWGNGNSLNPGATGWSDQQTYGIGLYTGTYTITPPNGCVEELDFNVFVGDVPDGGAVANGNTTICVGDDITLSWTNINNNPPGTNYIVDWGDGNVETFTHPPPAVVPHTYTVSSCSQGNGEYSVNYEIENPCDTRTGGFDQVRVSETPVADFTLSTDTVCVNTPLTATDNSVGAQAPQCNTPNHVWSIAPGTYTLQSGTLGNTNGFPGTPALWTTGSASISVSFTAPGTYTITDEVGNNICGTDQLVRTVCVEEPPVPAFTLTPDQSCAPLLSNTDNLTTTANSCLVTYAWSVAHTPPPCGSAGNYTYLGGTNSTSFEPQFSFNDPGLYDVTLTAMNSCGNFPVTLPATVLAPPQVTLDPLAAICEGDCVAPSAVFEDCDNPITGYSWDFQNGTPGSANTAVPGTICFNTAGTQDVEVTVTNSCGQATDLVQLTVLAPPPPPIITGATQVCEGEPLLLSGPPGTTWNWTTPQGTVSTQNVSIPAATLAAAGTYTLTIGAGGCSASNSVQVTVDPLPVVDAGATFNICLNANAAPLNGSPAGGSWSGTGVTGPPWTFDPAAAGTGPHALLYSFTDAQGCAGTDILNVTVDPLPVANAGPDVTLCNEPVPHTLTGLPGPGTWSFDSQTTGATLAGNTYTPNGTGTDVILFSYVDAFGCDATDLVSITVVEPVVPVAGPNDTLCLSAPALQLSANPATSTWTLTVGSAGNVTPGGLYTPAAAGTDTAVACLTTANCARCDTVLLTVLTLPTVDAGADFNVCVDGSATNLLGSPAGGAWSGTGVNGTPPYSFDPGLAGVGAWALTYTWTDASGCTNSDVLTVTVDPLPTADAGPDTTLCDEPVPYALGGLPAPGVWTFDQQGTGATLAGTQYTPNGTGTDVLVYTYTDASGCTATDLVSIAVVAPVVPNAGPDDSLCVSANRQFPTNPNAQWSLSAGSQGTMTPGGAYTPGGVGVDTLVLCQITANCVRCDSLLLTVLPLPVVNAGADLSSCVDGAALPLTGNPAGGSWTGPGTSAGAPWTFDPGVAGVGLHELVYLWTDAFGCANTDTLFATVDPLPVADAGPDTTLCDEPLPFLFTPSPGSGSWSFVTLATAAVLTNTNYTPGGPGTDSLLFTYVDASGCTATDTLAITVVTPVVPDAGPDDSLCVSAPNQLFTAVPATSTWTLTPGSTGSITPGGTYTPGVVGTDTLVACQTTANCVRCDSLLLTVLPLPVVDAGVDYSICQDASVQQLSATPVGGNWDQPNLFDPDTLAPGPNTWCYSYTDPGTGCLNTDCIVVTIDSVPQPLFSIPDTACVNSPVFFDNLTVCNCTYAWDLGDGTTSTAVDTSHAYASTGTYTVTLIATSGPGCTDTLSSTITVIEPPTVGFTFGPGQGCGPLTVNLTNTSQGSPISYAWDIETFGPSSQAQPGPVVFPTAPCDSIYYTIELTASNQCGGQTHTDSVLVFAPPQPTFLVNTNTVCSPDTIQFLNTTTCAWNTTYSWSFGDGDSSFTQAPSLQHLYTTDSLIVQYPVVLSATNACGSATALDTITVLPNTVDAFFNANPLVGCPPLPVQFIQSTVGITQWTWEFGDGTQSTALDPQHIYFNAGTFQVEFWATNGCASDTMVQQVVVLPPPVFDFTATPDSVCVGEEVAFSPSGQNISGLAWDLGDGTASNQTAPVHSYAAQGTYDVALSAISTLNGCIDTVMHPVVVLPTPDASFTLSPLEGCTPLFVEFTDTSTDTDFASWTFGDGNTAAGNGVFHTYDSAATYPVQMMAMNLNGCLDSAQASVVVHPVPTAAFTYSITELPDAVLPVEFDDLSSGGVNYTWTFGDGEGSTYNAPGHLYQLGPLCSFSPMLVVTNEFGCSDTAVRVITVPRDMRVWAPNAFTPTGDGLNEEFVVQGADIDLGSVQLTIFDRWGNLVHEVKGATPSWDGTMNGELCKNDVYVWRLKARLQCGYDEEEHFGHVTLVR